MKTTCCFCYPSEQGKHGEVRRELFEFAGRESVLPVCRKHSQEEHDKQQNSNLETHPV